MIKLVRFAIVLALVLWLGVTITVTFYVGPSLFNDASGHVPNSTVAADIIAPLLAGMDRTAWIALSGALALHGLLWAMTAGGARRLIALSALLLALALGSTLYTGLSVNPELHRIRAEFKEELGGYHLAPEDDPGRRRFATLHGLVMVLTLLNLGLGLGSLFCVTQGGGGIGEKRVADAESATVASSRSESKAAV